MLTRTKTDEAVGLFLFEVALFAWPMYQLGEFHRFVGAGVIIVCDLLHPLPKGL